MRAYISVGYSKRKVLAEEVNAIKETLLTSKIEPIVFVDEFRFTTLQEKEMMVKALRSIDDCDILIAEVSDKAIGIGVEAGYAKAKGKTVIYLRNKTAEHSTTVSGIGDFSLIYNDVADLKFLLIEVLHELSAKK